MVLFIAFGGTGWARAQPGVAVTGVVLDAQTEEPLEGAHIFVVNTLKGTTTDAQGRFRIEGLTFGSHELVVSFLGYQNVVRSVRLMPQRRPVLTVRLEPTTMEGRGVEVRAEADAAWKGQLGRFEEFFLGVSPNAERCEILNPEVLTFEEKNGTFTARADAPLVIDNWALGYRLQFMLERFQMRTEGRNRTISYTGKVGFAELEPEGRREARRWRRRRARAYRGSMRHFLAALAANRLFQEGFVLVREGEDGSGAYYGVPGSRAAQRVNGVDPEEVVGPGELPNERTLAFRGALKVIYSKEPPSQQFIDFQRYAGWRVQPEEDRQISWISLNRPDVTFTTDGFVDESFAITKVGYWYFERVADMLPREYEPDDPLVPDSRLVAQARPTAAPPQRDVAAEAEAGWRAWVTEDYALAAEHLGVVVDAEPDYRFREQGPAAYWLGRAYQAQGLHELAHRAWHDGLAAVTMDSTWSVEMADRLVRSVYATGHRTAYESATRAYLDLLSAADRPALSEADAAIVRRHIDQARSVLSDSLVAHVYEDPARNTPQLHPEAGSRLARWWRAQDPLPGTPLNERLSEHLERVAYAEEHFAYARGSAGFDDRGAVYVRYGAPRIKTIIRPDLNTTMAVYRENAVPLPGPLVVPPNEFWSYRHIGEEAYFLFVLRQGRYRESTPEDLVPREVKTLSQRSGRLPRTMNASSRQDGAAGLALFEAYKSLYTNLATAHPAFEDHLQQIELFEADVRAASLGMTQPDEMATSVAALQIRGMASRFEELSRIAEQRREERAPQAFSRVMVGVEPLPVAARAIRRLSEDGTTRAEIIWSHLPGTLRPTRQQRRTILEEQSELPDRYLIDFALTLHSEDFSEALPTRLRYLAQDLPQGAEVPVQTIDVERIDQPFHLTAQWDQYLAIIDDAAQTASRGDHLRTGVVRFDVGDPLERDPAVLEMSDLKPVYLDPDAGLPTADEDVAGLTAYPYPTIVPETEIGLYFEVYHLAYGPDDVADYTVEYEIERGDERTSARTTHAGTERTTNEFVAVDLTEFAGAGPLDIVIRVTDNVTGQVVERAMELTLVR